MQKMKRKDIQICLFLAFVFIATRSYSATAMRIRKAEPGSFKLKPAQSSEGSAAGFLSATWNKSGMQVINSYRKVPSVPNPIGNRHPPAKHD
ncbi:CLAVATA3/ESR (CLE)-related protein 46-like [Juglans microcarpa x Juglans regia]|uniref:CLAVATA3/ESR (CLE)-related protein 46-like n=1 Tax=Juglans microcarpa x Juglans regia TaxID=2249226 RepID=UPI001B7DD0CB|nr:CLAVATA3/ESR (CLE)-related protein 46-like [Juglans microcarpa x Juglans regia]